MTLMDFYEHILNHTVTSADKRILYYGSWLRKNDPDKFKKDFIDFTGYY